MADPSNIELRNAIMNYFEANSNNQIHDFENQIKDKDIIILFGNTRSGKSTLANHLIGTPLEAFEPYPRNYRIRKQNIHDIGPEIGQGSLSSTTYPTIYPVKGSDAYIIDLPGFEDNRGIVQDIANATFFNKIKVARALKFVIVFDIAELESDNIRPFTQTLKYVQDLVSNFDEIKNSFYFIFTKDNKHYTQQDIIYFLKNKVLNVQDLNVDKILISNVADNEQFIGLFRMPSYNGPVSNTDDINIENAIKFAHFADIEKCKIKFTISDQANAALLQIYPEYTDSKYFDEEIGRLTLQQSEYFTIDKYVYASYDDELTTTLNSLSDISVYIYTESHTNITTLRGILDSLNSILLNVLGERTFNYFKSHFEFVIVMDESKLMQKKHRRRVIENYKKSLDNHYNKIYSLIQKIKDEQADRRNSNFLFGVCAVGGIVGAVPAGAGISTVAQRLVTSEGIVQTLATPGATAFTATEAAISTVATTAVSLVGGVAVGASIGVAYRNYRERYSKREEARRSQRRG